MRSKTACSLFLCLVVFLALPAFSEGQDRRPIDEREFVSGVFLEATHAQALSVRAESALEPDATHIRSRLVHVNLNEFARQERAIRTSPVDRDSVVLNLFDDASFTVRLDRVEKTASGATTFYGNVLDESDSAVILTLLDGVMAGTVTRGNENYTIRFVGEDIYEIAQADHSKFAECKEPATSNPLPEEGQPGFTAIAEGRPELVSSDADTGSTLDVMVVYTPTTRTAAGGTTAINATINQAVAETNAGYANSQINPRIRLVYTAEVSYSEKGFNWDRTITRLAGKTDGYMDNVHTLRDTYKADMVVMIVEDGAWCGLANAIMATESGAFALVSRTCATGYYSFGHEMGHLQGARHDRYVDSTENSPYADNHGYAYVSGRWRTVMAYNNACTAAGVSCTRINYWSNPGVLYGGVATGVAGGTGVGTDNHKCLNTTANTVANFRLAGN